MTFVGHSLFVNLTVIITTGILLKSMLKEKMPFRWIFWGGIAWLSHLTGSPVEFQIDGL